MAKDLLGLGTDAKPPVVGEAPQVVAQTELYPPDVTLRTEFAQHRDALADVGDSQAEIAARERDFVAVIKETNLETFVLGRQLYGLLASADIAAAHGTDVTAAQVAAWAEDSRRTLREQYGREEGEQLLARASKFVKAHPKLAAVLSRGGIGSRPEVVAAIARHVRDVNFR